MQLIWGVDINAMIERYYFNLWRKLSSCDKQVDLMLACVFLHLYKLITVSLNQEHFLHILDYFASG